MANTITTSYLLVDHGEGLEEEEPLAEGRDRGEEKTVVTKLMESFRSEIDKTKAAGEDAVKKVRVAAYTARRKESVQNLKKLSSHPPSKGVMAAMKKKE